MNRHKQRKNAARQYCITESMIDAFHRGAKWADKTIVKRLQELKSGYEKDLDAEPRVYERDIQLCAKISLIDRIIIELEGKL